MNFQSAYISVQTLVEFLGVGEVNGGEMPTFWKQPYYLNVKIGEQLWIHPVYKNFVKTVLAERLGSRLGISGSEERGF